MGHWGPWIQDPDITVGPAYLPGPSKALEAGSTHTYVQDYTLTDINNAMHADAGPDVEALIPDDISTYDPGGVGTSGGGLRRITLTRTSYTTGTGAGGIHAQFSEQAIASQISLLVHPTDSGWAPPLLPGLEVDGLPEVIAGHLEFSLVQTPEPSRTPDFTATGDLHTYTFDMPDLATPNIASKTEVSHISVAWEDSSTITSSLVLDLGGDQLLGVLLHPYLVVNTSSWLFSSAILTTDALALGVNLEIDTGASFYTWRPPRYRQFIEDTIDPARRLWPRDDDAGPALGRIYPQPNTAQSGRRFGSGAPY